MAAEFLGRGPRPSDPITAAGMDAFGRAVPLHRKTEGLRHLREMCGDRYNTEQATMCIDRMCQQIERDQPYEAMKEAARYLDMTGAYRLLAVLLTAPKPKVRRKAGRV